MKNFIYWLKGFDIFNVLSTVFAIVSVIFIIMIPIKLNEQSKAKTDSKNAYQIYLATKETKKDSNTSKTDDNKSDSNVKQLSTTVDKALDAFITQEQKYLKAYIAQEKEFKSTLGNVDQNTVLKPIKDEFGTDIIPILKGSELEQLLFEPYAYTDPTLTMSKVTPIGKHKYDILFIVESKKDDLRKYITATYDSSTNIITVDDTYKEPAKTSELGTPTSPDFDI